MRLKTRLALDPYRVKIKPPVQRVVLIFFSEIAVCSRCGSVVLKKRVH